MICEDCITEGCMWRDNNAIDVTECKDKVVEK